MMRESATRLYLGNSFTWTETFPYAVMAQGDEDMMVLDREGNALSFSAKFFDANGKILCEVAKNRFQRNPNNTWRIDTTPPSPYCVRR